MKIVIAAWHLQDFNVGLGRYCRELIEAIGRVDTENRYEILMPDGSYRFPERPNMRYRLIRFPFFKRRFWEQVAPVLAGRYDLLHFPYDAGIAWKRGKVVVTVHDVKPMIFGVGRSPINLNRLIERVLVLDKWARIDHVLTDSQCSKRDIIQHLGIPDNRTTVVYPGVELDRFRPAPSDELRPHPSPLPRGERERPYVFCVAGADPTKNVETLVEAFARLPLSLRDGHDLVLAGDFRRRADLREHIARAGLEKQAIFTGMVSDERLIELYRHARLFVFPSRYEGFGLPVLEAMACGCPVVSSNASSLPEVAGDAAILLDPMDVNGFTCEMERILTDPALHRNLRERGLAQAARFSWDRTAREMIAVYEKVVEKGCVS
ncbi:MAG: glycosyltransferase family 4 protein [Nitrospirae bacterium]|nr:glycosyltransferase family 4 protein [Nitrospirota bacterium]